ncbi:MAG: hypothetical protein ACREDE_09730, partial [Thermoplasmata archaeon]
MANVLGLLLLVTAIASLGLAPLSAQMQEYEYEHELQVADQLGTLAAMVLEVAHHSGTDVLPVLAPLSLGSKAAPPFAPGSTGEVDFVPSQSHASATYSVGTYSFEPPLWGSGSLCPGGPSSCHSPTSKQCTPPLSYNFSGSNMSFSPRITGTGDCLVLNLEGNNSVFTLSISGSNFHGMNIVLLGSYDFLNIQLSGHGVSNASSIELFGQRNSYNLSMSGSHATFNTVFIGESPSTPICPYQNISSSDTANVSASGSSNIQNLTWYNQEGYSTPYTLTGGSSGIEVGYQNISATIGCAFTVVIASSYPAAADGGFSVDLRNSYLPAVQYSY